jgi:ERF superfamily
MAVTATKAKNTQQQPASKPPAKPKPKAKAKSKALVIQHPSAPQSLLQICANAARDPKTDVAKMQAILGMLEDQQTKAARAEFDAAMLDAKEDLLPVIKDSWNPHTKSKYANLEKVSAAIDPVAKRHGFTISYGMADSPLDDHYRILADVTHNTIVNGKRVSFTKQFLADIGMDTVGAKGGGTKSGAQGSGSSISYGRRYLKAMIFDLAIVGEDNDGAGTKKTAALSQKQLDALTEMLEGDEALTDKFLSAYSIGTVEALPPAKFDEALARLKVAKANRAAPKGGGK